LSWHVALQGNYQLVIITGVSSAILSPFS